MGVGGGKREQGREGEVQKKEGEIDAFLGLFVE